METLEPVLDDEGNEVEVDRPFLFRQVEIIRPGVWNDWPFDEYDIRDLVSNFDRSDPPPLQVDHSRSAESTHGRVVDVMVDESLGFPRVVGLVLFLGSYAIERALDQRWDKFSANVWLYPAWMDELTVTPFPAVPHARSLSKTNDEESVMDEDEDKTQGQETSPETTPEPEAEAETPPEPEAQDKSQEEDPQSLAALVAKQNAELAELRAEVALSKADLRESGIREKVMSLVREGYSTPDLFDDEVSLCKSLDEEQTTKYFALRKKMAKQWNPGRKSQPVSRPLSGKGQHTQKADAALRESVGLTAKA